MKIVVIVYAVSWLILLIVYIISLFENKKSKKKDDALEKLLNKHKSTKDKILDKLVYVIMIIFAPVVVLFVPYIAFKHIKTKREAKIREEAREKSEREKKEHKADCIEKYAKMAGVKQTLSGSNYVGIAQSLNDLVMKKSYQKVIDLLDKVSLPPAMKLKVRECDKQGTGGISRLFIECPDDPCDYNIYDHLRFEDSPMGAWQAYLLGRMWHYLPLWWHANYDRRDYIYSKDDYNHITHFIDRKFNVNVLSDFDVAPEIYGENGKYYISCCFWTDFGGLKREFVEVTIQGSKVKDLFVFDEKTIFEYQCGIMF